jgi:hypothetical protein
MARRKACLPLLEPGLRWELPGRRGLGKLMAVLVVSAFVAGARPGAVVVVVQRKMHIFLLDVNVCVVGVG